MSESWFTYMDKILARERAELWLSKYQWRVNLTTFAIYVLFSLMCMLIWVNAEAYQCKCIRMVLMFFGGTQLSMHLKSAGSAGMSVRCHQHGLMSFLPALVASWIVSLHIFARTHCQNVFVGFLSTDATAHWAEGHIKDLLIWWQVTWLLLLIV